MKKFLLSFIVLVSLCCAVALAACGNSQSELVLNKYYILSDDVKADVSEQVTYVFFADGTGEYTYHYDYEGSSGYSEHSHYVIKFKYTYTDSDKSAVVCFYDGVETLEVNTSAVSTGWTRLLTVSKNVLMATGSYGYSFYINEDYLSTIPNYQQTAA